METFRGRRAIAFLIALGGIAVAVAGCQSALDGQSDGADGGGGQVADAPISTLVPTVVPTETAAAAPTVTLDVSEDASQAAPRPSPMPRPTSTPIPGPTATPFGDYDIITVLRKDAIPAILNPQMVDANEARGWMAPGEQVLGLNINGDARAYPTAMLSSHEIANDVVGGVPVAVTW